MSQPKYITYKGAKYERIPTLNEIKVDPIPPLTIQSIELASNQYGPNAFAALGVNYYVTLNNNRTILITASSLEDRYPKDLTTREILPGIRDWRTDIDQLNTLLRNKTWDDTMELEEIVVSPRLQIIGLTLSSHRTPGVAYGALDPRDYDVKLTNGTTVQATAYELLERYWETVPEIQKIDNITPEELEKLLKRKIWDEEY